MAQGPTSPDRALELTVPIEWAGEKITSLKFKRPTAAQLWTFPLPASTSKNPSLPMGELLAVGAKCCGLPDDAIRLLDAYDALQLATMVGECLGSSRLTGI